MFVGNHKDDKNCRI